MCFAFTFWFDSFLLFILQQPESSKTFCSKLLLPKGKRENLFCRGQFYGVFNTFVALWLLLIFFAWGEFCIYCIKSMLVKWHLKNEFVSPSFSIINISKYLFYPHRLLTLLWCYHIEKEEKVVQIIRRRYIHYLNFNGFS